MKRTTLSILAVILLSSATFAADNGWPHELAGVERMVRSTLGDIPYYRVAVSRQGKVTDVSIKLRHVPRLFKALGTARSGDEEIFIASNINALAKPDLGFSQEHDLTPRANLVDQFFGFGVFNFGKRIKRSAKIVVTNFETGEVEVVNEKKKYKLKKKRVQLRFVEAGVSSAGLHSLETSVGPHTLVSWFCASCLEP